MKNFVIPFNFEALLESSTSQYSVEEVFSLRLLPIKLQNAKIAFAKEGGIAVLDHFDTVYSVISRFSNLDNVVKQQSWDMLIKGGKMYGVFLASVLSEKGDGSPELTTEFREKHKNGLKMIVYLLVQMAELFHSKFNQLSESVGKNIQTGKKRTKSTKSKNDDDQLQYWIEECEMLVRLLMTYVDLDIHRFWEPELVEDDFVNLISGICYKMMESQALYKASELKAPVFHVLGCLLKKFDLIMGTSVKVLQLLQHFPYLAAPLATDAVSMWYDNYKCKTIVTAVLRELSHIPQDEFIRDSDSAKNVGVFLVELAKSAPTATLANFSLMLERMNEDSYTMRNTVLVMMGEIVLRCLTGEGLDEKAKSARDQFLDILLDHANLDPNAFTRSKSLQVWIMLVKEQALPLKRYLELVHLCESVLFDKSNLVRRFAVQLLEAVLQFNPFAAKLPLDVLQEGRNDAKAKLAQLEAELQKETAVSNQEETSSEAAERVSDEGDLFQSEEGTSQENDDEHPSENPEITKQKNIVEYLENSVQFVERLQACVPALCDLLRSKVTSDVIEAINFFTAACQFKLDFAIIGVTAMLQQIWHEEQKIRDAVVSAYKLLYFTPEAETPRARAGIIVDNLMIFVSISSFGKLRCLEVLLKHLVESDSIPHGLTQILWDRFAKPELNNSTSSNKIDTYEQQRLAVQLLGFLAETNPSIVKNKIDILVTHGLKVIDEFPENPSSSVDFSLALHTCEALGKLKGKKAAAGEYQRSVRLPETHEMFSCLHQLVVTGFIHPSDNWEHFTMEAIALIYDLSEKPDKFCEVAIREMLDIIQHNNDNPDLKVKSMLLTRFYLAIGQICMKHLVYLEVAVQAELKHRRKLKERKEESEKKKADESRRMEDANSSNANLEDDMGVGGATADDAEQEHIKNITENSMMGKDNLFGLLAPCLVRACLATTFDEHPVSVAVQATASLALAKFMQVSSKFCEDHLQLLFTLLEKSPHETVRANLVVPIGDLCVRFPNLLEPWTAHLYARLKDESSLVRIYTVKVLSNLILNDMVKVKGHVSEMARCTVDTDEDIAMLIKKFFTELSTKGNAIYNVMPDIISRLSSPDANVKEEQFQEIMKFLFTFIQKEKHSDSLVEKLCHRFSATRTRRQWQDLALCLSLLSYSDKSVRKLQENFSLFADKLADEQVYQSFSVIITKARKLSKAEMKVQVDELSSLIDECHKKGVSDDQTAAKAAAVVKKSRRISSIRSPRASIAWPTKSPITGRRTVKATRKRLSIVSDSDSEDAQDFHSSSRQNVQPPAGTKTTAEPAEHITGNTRKATRRVTVEFSSDSEDDNAKENVAVLRNSDVEEQSSIDDSENSTPIRRKKTPVRRTTRSMVRT